QLAELFLPRRGDRPRGRRDGVQDRVLSQIAGAAVARPRGLPPQAAAAARGAAERAGGGGAQRRDLSDLTVVIPSVSEGPGWAGGAPHARPGPSLTLGMTQPANRGARPAV